jgi:hypothetical protein
LTPEEKLAELKRHRDIILATIDYIVVRIAVGMTHEHVDIIEGHFQQQKHQTEKYYQTRRLDRLQQRLYRLTEYPRRRGDLGFASYIKEKTGYHIDIFENVQSQVYTIIEQNLIRNKKELDDVSIMLDVYKQHPIDQNKLDILKRLVIEFSKRTSQQKLSKQRED